MSQSSDVTAGTDILATEYNDLRQDVVHDTASHDHTGTGSMGKQLTLADAISDVDATGVEINAVLAGIDTTSVYTTSLENVLGGGDGDLFHKHSGVLLAAGRLYKNSAANNANATLDLEINIPVGFVAGYIKIDIAVYAYGDGNRLHYISNLLYNGTAWNAQSVQETKDHGIYDISGVFTFAGSGTERRDVTVSVDSITFDDGNDVIIRCAFVVAGSPGTNYSFVQGTYQIFAA